MERIEQIFFQIKLPLEYKFVSTTNEVRFIRTCNYLLKHLTTLRTITFWLYLTRKEAEMATNIPESQYWLQACKRLVSEKAKKVDVRLGVIGRASIARHSSTYTYKLVRYPTACYGDWIEVDRDGKRYKLEDHESMLLKWLTLGRVFGRTEDFQDDLGLETLFKEVNIGL